VYVVSTWVGDEQIALGQVAVDGKSDEITTIPKLLDLLDIREYFQGLRAVVYQQRG
jgi:hypothetical protein